MGARTGVILEAGVDAGGRGQRVAIENVVALRHVLCTMGPERVSWLIVLRFKPKDHVQIDEVGRRLVVSRLVLVRTRRER